MLHFARLSRRKTKIAPQIDARHGLGGRDHFRDDAVETDKAPAEHVVVFDEAQRAWDREHTNRFMASKRNHPSFDASEPEFLIGVMDRHSDWCVVVALIGEGQEINSGEAGVSEWLTALRRKFPHWRVSCPETQTFEDFSSEEKLMVHVEKALHLGVSMRSFRSEMLSDFVAALIQGDPISAKKLYSEIADRYPIFLTRSLKMAKAWVKGQARGNQLFGVMASSGAARLKPEGVFVSSRIEPENWFLNGKEDVRGCQYLEEVATEFDIQGLELEWGILCWDANLRVENNEWNFYRFKGAKWQSVSRDVLRKYLLNAYRVLLTRCRQGFVIFVPPGDLNDPTRVPEFYDPVYEYLRRCGIPELTN